MVTSELLNELLVS